MQIIGLNQTNTITLNLNANLFIPHSNSIHFKRMSLLEVLDILKLECKILWCGNVLPTFWCEKRRLLSLNWNNVSKFQIIKSLAVIGYAFFIVINGFISAVSTNLSLIKRLVCGFLAFVTSTVIGTGTYTILHWKDPFVILNTLLVYERRNNGPTKCCKL